MQSAQLTRTYQGAVNDAWNLFSTLRVSLGFPEPNVKLLVDTEKGERAPTKANILRALDTVVSGCPENVLILSPSLPAFSFTDRLQSYSKHISANVLQTEKKVQKKCTSTIKTMRYPH